MTLLSRICVCGLIAALAATSPVWALSLPPGARTLFMQIEMSDSIVLARFRAASSDSASFSTEQVLHGSAGPEVRVRFPEGRTTLGNFKPTERCLLMLERGENGTFALPLDSFSILRVPDDELSETLSAVRAWVQSGEDLASRRATLVRFATARAPFLQRSAVMGLTLLQLMDRPTLRSLVDRLAADRVVDAEARELIVRFTGVMGATEHRSFLTSRVRDRTETRELREASLFALHAMDPSAARELAPEIQSGAIPDLRPLMRSLMP
jgi:hypothetical protein